MSIWNDHISHLYDKELFRLFEICSNEDIETVADAIASEGFAPDSCGNERESAKHLLCACLGLLRDWLPPEEYTLHSLIALLCLVDACEGDEDFKSPLDLLFLQIEEGRHFVESLCGSDWSWEPSKFRRNSDGVEPGKCGGLSPDEDYALMNYKNFIQDTPPAERPRIALRLVCMLLPSYF